MSNTGTRLFAVFLAVVFAFLVYVIGGYCWSLAITPFATQNILGILLFLLSGAGTLVFLLFCVSSIIYAILGESL